MCFNLTILGSASALPDSRQISTAQVLQYKNQYYLFDCAEGTQIRLRQNKIAFARINYIFISHLHGDHYFGIFGLLKSFELLGRRKALNIYSPPGLKKKINTVFEEIESKFPLIFHELDVEKPALALDKKTFYVKSFPLKHRTHTCGFIFKEKQKNLNIKKEAIKTHNLSFADIQKIKKGQDFISPSGETIPNENLTLAPYKTRAFAFCTDTAYHPPVIDNISGADILYHEATFSQADQKIAETTRHSTSADAAEIAKSAGVKKLLIGHISNRYTRPEIIKNEACRIFKNTERAHENETYSVPLVRRENHV